MDDAVLKLIGTADRSTMMAANMKKVKLAPFPILNQNLLPLRQSLKASRMRYILLIEVVFV